MRKKGNLLSKPVEGQGLNVIGITKYRDFTNSDTVKGIIQKIKRSRRCFLVLFTVHRRFNVAAFELRTGQAEGLEQNNCETYCTLGPPLETLGTL